MGCYVCDVLLSSLWLAAALAVPPPVLPPSGGQLRGERAAKKAEAEARADTQPVPSAASLGLTADGDGGWLYEDPGGQFKARIGDDGAVAFASRWRRPAGKAKRSKRRRKGRCCGKPPGGVFPAVNVLMGAPVSGPTEWVFRSRGADPTAAAKAHFLAQTASFRTVLAVEHQRGQMRAALDTLEDSLQRLWEDPQIPESHKRRITFERWDALADEPPGDRAVSSLDRLRASYATRARRRIEAFIRRRLPVGSGQEFSATELSHLNERRRSVVKFSPYRKRLVEDPREQTQEQDKTDG